MLVSFGTSNSVESQNIKNPTLEWNYLISMINPPSQIRCLHLNPWVALRLLGGRI